MDDKTYLYNWEENDLENLKPIEVESFKKANELNDKLLDLKTLIDEINYDWKEFMQFQEDNGISKICTFYGKDTIEFNDELLHAISNTLKKSLVDIQKEMNFNSKKISINRMVDG